MSNNIDEQVQQVEDKKWVRSYGWKGSNIFGKVPEMTFHVERARLIDNKEYTASHLKDLRVVFDATATFPLLHPMDDSVIPDAALVTLPRHIQIQVLLYSLFKHEMSK